MSVKVYQSKLNNSADAVAEIKEKLSGTNPKLVFYFTSSNHNLKEVAEGFGNAFPNSETVGCTTSGEIISNSMDKNSIVAMALSEDKVKNLSVQVIENLSNNFNLDKNIESINSKLGDFASLDIDKYYGIILVDGLSGAEENLMDRLGNKTNINIVGASAGDDLKFKQTNVMHNGKIYTNAAVLAVVESAVNFEIVKTQSFKATDKVLIPTKVNSATREVLEFNNKPAVEAYSEALGVDAEKASEHFMSHPVGLMAGHEPYVRSPQMITDNGTMKFYCNVAEGMELKILESTDIINDTKKDVEEKLQSGSINGIINFNCILRTLELESKNLTKEYSELFNNYPTIGFSTYGEEFIGHINQTATMLVLR